MDPKYQRVLAPKLQEHANSYQLTDVSFRSAILLCKTLQFADLLTGSRQVTWLQLNVLEGR